MAEITFALDRGNRFTDADGRLHIRVTNISKANVCPYKGSEIPGWEELGLESERVYQLYRDPEELAKAAPTFNNIQLLETHMPVSANDPKRERVVGSTGTDCEFAAPYLKNSLVIWDAEAIAAINSGEKRELSCGYRYTPDMTAGSNGSATYDGIMRVIVGNHVALVGAGRAGPDVVVADEKLEIGSMSKVATALKAKLEKLAQDGKVDIASVIKAQDEAEKECETEDAKARDAMKRTRDDEDRDSEEAGYDEAESEADKDDKSDAAKDRAKGRDKRARDRAGRASDRAKARDGGARDEETEEERKARGEDARKRGHDRGARDAAGRAKDTLPENAVSKEAMDAALKATETATVARMNAVRDAERAVRPYVGELAVTMDSAEAVYKFALDALKVDVKGVDPSAYRTILGMQPKPGATPKLATDAVSDDDRTARFGEHANRVIPA